MESELFTFHSERMSEILVNEVQTVSLLPPYNDSFMPLMSLCLEHKSTRTTHRLQRPPDPWQARSKLFSIT